MCGEKWIELNGVRADLYPDPTPLLFAGEKRAALPALLSGGA